MKQAIDTVDVHRLSKLIELCKEHNYLNPEKIIYLSKYKNADELVFNLWRNDIDVGVLGFGFPYDEMLRDWIWDTEGDEGNIENNMLYLSYVHSDDIPNFLYYSLFLPKKCGYNHNDETTLFNNIKLFNEFWVKLGKEPIENYHDFRQILDSKILTRIELCCILWECHNYNIFVPDIFLYDYMDRYKTWRS